MKFSKNWLQEYIVDTLPEDKIIEEELNAKAFEVEGIENYSSAYGKVNSIFDIKVLPNRAHDALGHVGMASEICACLDLTFKNDHKSEIENIKNNLESKDLNIENKIINFSGEEVLVEVIDKKACTRFSTIKIDGVVVGESPEFIKQALQSIGQKSINNIVDITNYVQFMLNKPMHAYDANNIEGGIIVRYATEGEKLVTLDDKELDLNISTLVIADHKKVLGLAGIKGGKYSGVSAATTSVIIESANFEATLIRKTSQKYNLKTDASKRFENGIADTLVINALYETVRLILKYATSEDKEVKISEVKDIRQDNYTDINYVVGVKKDEINSILGSNYDEAEIENSLNKLGFNFKKIIPEEKIRKLVELSMGGKYKRGASALRDAPNEFDCSSLINYLFTQSRGGNPRISIDQFVFSKKIEKEDLVYGDLIFLNTNDLKTKDETIYESKINPGMIIKDLGIRTESIDFMRGTKIENGVDHVGMYVGENKVLHCASSIGKVIIEDIDESSIFSKNTLSYGRYFDNLSDEVYLVTVPHERLDLKIKEDIIEEIGRIIGYKTLVPTLPKLEPKKNYLNKKLSYQNIIRNILFTNNFSEVMNYSFVEKGDVSLIKSAVNKNKLRTSIGEGMLIAVNQNLSNLPVLNMGTVRVFEFGNVFGKDIESNDLCISIDDGKKKSNFTENIDMILSEIKSKLGLEKLEYEVKNVKPYVIEINFDRVLQDLSDEYLDAFIDEKYINRNTKFESYSIMPFVVRDIAFWIDENSDLLMNKNENKDGLLQDNIINIIKEVSGDLCIRVTKFDEFKKEVDGVQKISLGYRLLYQSNTKTLTDEEVNMQSDNVYAKLRELGLEVR